MPIFPTQYPNTYPYVNGITVLYPGTSAILLWEDLAIDWEDETATWEELQPQ